MKTVLITGANRGIGFEIARQLGRKGFRVFAAARDAGRGEKAVELLRGEAIQAECITMDTSSTASINAAAARFAAFQIQLDVLINNAAVYPDKESERSMPETLARTLVTNTVGPFAVIQAFQKFIPRGGRIINISSGMGALHDMRDTGTAYSISKAALNAVTRQYAAALEASGIAVNSVCPGWVRTDMGGKNAPRSVEKGAETPVWLATEAPLQLTGKFLRDKKEIAW